mmetsp:Transcript_49565/g.131024  ORF Transcript_49565/g.131024 Transcript_49565/m.131024 type:complete len:192 (-) Transcript_49565:287-862(-)
MYVQYAAPGQMAPGAYYPAAVGSGGYYTTMQSPYSSRATGAPQFAQAPAAAPMFQTPRDPYTHVAAAPAAAPTYGAYAAPQQDPQRYAQAGWQQQPQAMPQYSAHAEKPASPSPWAQAPGTPTMQQPTMQPAMGAAPMTMQQALGAQDPDPDDDPNRLPTFVKVRGLPAEHDPRIARRPKPKKRAPGVCCA